MGIRVPHNSSSLTAHFDISSFPGSQDRLRIKAAASQQTGLKVVPRAANHGGPTVGAQGRACAINIENDRYSRCLLCHFRDRPILSIHAQKLHSILNGQIPMTLSQPTPISFLYTQYNMTPASHIDSTRSPQTLSSSIVLLTWS